VASKQSKEHLRKALQPGGWVMDGLCITEFHDLSNHFDVICTLEPF
jgi:hypothetical protein